MGFCPSPLLTSDTLQRERNRMQEVDKDGCSKWTEFEEGWSPRGQVYQVDEDGSLYWPSVCGTPHPIKALRDQDSWEGQPNAPTHAVVVELKLAEPVNTFPSFK